MFRRLCPKSYSVRQRSHGLQLAAFALTAAMTFSTVQAEGPAGKPPPTPAASAHAATLESDRPQTPLCIYHVGFDDLAYVAALGFNCVTYMFKPDARGMSDGDRAFFNRARSVGLFVLPEFSWHLRRGTLENLPILAAEVGRDPATMAFYVADEPSYWKIPSAHVATACELVRRAAPVHPCFALDIRDKASSLVESVDIVGLDHYPVMWPDRSYGFPSARRDSLASVGRYVDTVVRSAQGKPVWVAIQAHRPPANRDYPNPRYPTPEELRAMTFLAMNNGADGLLFYAWNDNTKENPGLVAALPGIIRDVVSLAPAYREGRIERGVEAGELDAVTLRLRDTEVHVVVNPAARALADPRPVSQRRQIQPFEVRIERVSSPGDSR